MSDKKQLLKLLREQRIRQIKGSFWEFLKEFSPTIKRTGNKLYRDEVTYLKELAEDLQSLIENELILEDGNIARGICISLPPRHAKSLTVKNLSKWLLISNPNIRIITASYSQTLVDAFSKEIRNSIKDSEKGIGSVIKYGDVFEGLELSKDSKSAKKWKLQNSSHDYNLATGSFRTGITGLGTDVLIVDDPIKNSEEALNEKALEDKWNLFTDTFMSRVEGDGKYIIIQTRWSEDDIIGRIQKSDTLRPLFKFVELKAVEEIKEGLVFLNPDLFTEEEYRIKKAEISDLIFEANYNQRIIDMDVALYKKYKLYEEFPEGEYKVVAVLDPSADGKDYTACLVGRHYKKINKIYLTNIYYSDAKITESEDDLVDFIASNDIYEIMIESNSAFKILTNNIKKALKKKGIVLNVKAFIQSKNKEARILTASNAVQESIYFMPDVSVKHKEAFNHFIRFKSDISANTHDDFEDCITSMWEKYIKEDLSIKTFDKRQFI